MTHPLQRIALVVHHGRPDALVAAGAMVERLHAAGHSVWVDSSGHDVASHPNIFDSQPMDTADLVVAIGGDGTVLRAVHMVAPSRIPILGINSGRLGYLTQAELVDRDDVLDRLLAGEVEGGWSVEERMMISVTATDDNGNTTTHQVLNEVVVEKLNSGNTVDLHVDIDSRPFISFATDGLIVATPTGSTAYSLSARGPVVSPRHRAMLLTPVAPHMLFDRTIVLDPSETIDITVNGERPAALVADGTVLRTLHRSSRVSCSVAPVSARFIRLVDRPYHQVLRAKFGLRDR